MTFSIASIEDLKEVYAIIRKYSDVFPFVRQDSIKRKILSDCCVYDSGVVITFTVYKKRRTIKDHDSDRKFIIDAGSVWIHQFVNSEPGNGKATEVLRRFATGFEKPVYLNVDQDNERALSFYMKFGFQKIAMKQYTISGQKKMYDVLCLPIKSSLI